MKEKAENGELASSVSQMSSLASL